jgi:hypothetical protein
MTNLGILTGDEINHFGSSVLLLSRISFKSIMFFPKLHVDYENPAFQSKMRITPDNKIQMTQANL